MEGLGKKIWLLLRAGRISNVSFEPYGKPDTLEIRPTKRGVDKALPRAFLRKSLPALAIMSLPFREHKNESTD
jgi:hypothetical protein